MPSAAAVLRPVLVALTLSLTPTLFASNLPAGAAPDPQTLSLMEQRAAQASPREQCFLYTELVDAMAEAAGRQLLDGESERAIATLHQMDAAEQHLRTALLRDARRLKNAEMLMHRTLFRMNSFLHAASSEDRATLQASIQRMDTLHTELMAQVFSH